MDNREQEHAHIARKKRLCEETIDIWASILIRDTNFGKQVKCPGVAAGKVLHCISAHSQKTSDDTSQPGSAARHRMRRPVQEDSIQQQLKTVGDQ